MVAKRKKLHDLKVLKGRDIQEMSATELEEFAYCLFADYAFRQICIFVYVIKRTLHLDSKILSLSSRGKNQSNIKLISSR